MFSKIIQSYILDNINSSSKKRGEYIGDDKIDVIYEEEDLLQSILDYAKIKTKTKNKDVNMSEVKDDEDKDKETVFYEHIPDFFPSGYSNNTLTEYYVGKSVNSIRKKVINFALTNCAIKYRDGYHIYYSLGNKPNVNSITLSEYISSPNFLIEEFYSIFIQIILALQKAQDKIGFVHGSLEPDCIRLVKSKDLEIGTLIYQLGSRLFTVQAGEYIPIITDYRTSRVVDKEGVPIVLNEGDKGENRGRKDLYGYLYSDDSNRGNPSVMDKSEDVNRLCKSIVALNRKEFSWLNYNFHNISSLIDFIKNNNPSIFESVVKISPREIKSKTFKWEERLCSFYNDEKFEDPIIKTYVSKISCSRAHKEGKLAVKWSELRRIINIKNEKLPLLEKFLYFINEKYKITKVDGLEIEGEGTREEEEKNEGTDNNAENLRRVIETIKGCTYKIDVLENFLLYLRFAETIKVELGIEQGVDASVIEKLFTVKLIEHYNREKCKNILMDKFYRVIHDLEDGKISRGDKIYRIFSAVEIALPALGKFIPY